MQGTHPAHETGKPPKSIVDFRQNIDKLINSTPFLRQSREVSLAHTNLQRGFMWLGKALGAAGGESPYKSSMDAASPVIEPTADHSETNLSTTWSAPEFQTHTARVKSLRGIIAEHLKEFSEWRKVYASPNTIIDYHHYLLNSRMAMEEASMWLGWELARIKKIQDGAGSIANGPTVDLPL